MAMRFINLLRRSILKTATELGDFYPVDLHLSDLASFGAAYAATQDKEIRKALERKLTALRTVYPDVYKQLEDTIGSDTNLLRYYLMTGDKKALKAIETRSSIDAKRARRLKLTGKMYSPDPGWEL